MHYWNDSNFEGLEALAEQLSEYEHLSGLADYCRLRANGLRSKAFEALDRFLDQAEGFPAEIRNETIDLIFSLALRTPDAHQFMSTPLHERFLRPGLDNWLAEQPHALSPLRWDGTVYINKASLMRVLAQDPADTHVRRLLIWHQFISPLDFAFHHIRESTLLSEIAEVEEWITKAEALIDNAPDREPFADYEEELTQYRQLMSDWTEFRDTGELSFPEWCARNEREHLWIGIPYCPK